MIYVLLLVVLLLVIFLFWLAYKDDSITFLIVAVLVLIWALNRIHMLIQGVLP